MRTLVSPAQMRALEARYFEESGVASLELMERAACQLVRQLERMLGGAWGRRCVFACGPGNNGGDGFAAARLFAARGGRALVLPLCAPEALKGDARTNYAALKSLERVERLRPWAYEALDRPDAWVDAAFGIGLSRPVDQRYQHLFERMEADRARGALVLAVDIASGLDGESGAALGAAVRADCTVSFQYPKLGQLLADGLDATGQLVVADIGLPEALVPEDAVTQVEQSDLQALLPVRRRNTHKGDYGRLLVVAGSRGMAGAAALCAQSALHAGAGLVSVACPGEVLPIVQQLAPCATAVPLSAREGVLDEGALPGLRAALAGKSGVALGPGVGRLAPSLVAAVLESGLPAVIDADALNALAGNRTLLNLLRPIHVITPHPGEAARLLGRPCGGPVETARALRALGAVALYKGASTLVWGERGTLSASGCAGMATGGSGDVLTGLIAALLAQGLPAERAAYLGAEVHALAGQAAAGRLSQTAMTAWDLMESLSQVFLALGR